MTRRKNIGIMDSRNREMYKRTTKNENQSTRYEIKGIERLESNSPTKNKRDSSLPRTSKQSQRQKTTKSHKNSFIESNLQINRFLSQEVKIKSQILEKLKMQQQ